MLRGIIIIFLAILRKNAFANSMQDSLIIHTEKCENFTSLELENLLKNMNTRSAPQATISARDFACTIIYLAKISKEASSISTSQIPSKRYFCTTECREEIEIVNKEIAKMSRSLDANYFRCKGNVQLETDRAQKAEIELETLLQDEISQAETAASSISSSFSANVAAISEQAQDIEENIRIDIDTEVERAKNAELALLRDCSCSGNGWGWASGWYWTWGKNVSNDEM